MSGKRAKIIRRLAYDAYNEYMKLPAKNAKASRAKFYNHFKRLWRDSHYGKRKLPLDLLFQRLEYNYPNLGRRAQRMGR